MNREYGLDYSESKYRKEYTVFSRGRKYEREKAMNEVGTRILSISDLHVPFQKPIETFRDYVNGVDVLQINGDVIDFSAISKFPKTYRNSPMEEIIEARQYLIELIDFIHPKRVLINYGNHDLRFQNYLAKNLDTDILELMPQTPLEIIVSDGFLHYNKKLRTKVWYEPISNVFDDISIEYTDNWHCKIGETIFCHPLTFKSGVMKTTTDAMQWFHNEGYQFTSLVVAHTHHLGEYVVGNTVLYEQGACCDTSKMVYADGRLSGSQKQGFIYIAQDKNGKILRDFTRLVCLN